MVHLEELESYEVVEVPEFGGGIAIWCRICETWLPDRNLCNLKDVVRIAEEHDH